MFAYVFLPFIVLRDEETALIHPARAGSPRLAATRTTSADGRARRPSPAQRRRTTSKWSEAARAAQSEKCHGTKLNPNDNFPIDALG